MPTMPPVKGTVLEKYQAWNHKPSSAWIAIATFLLGAIILTCAFLQSQFALFHYKEWVIPNMEKIQQVKSAWKIRIPSWTRGSLAEQYAIFKVDGKPVGTRDGHTTTVAQKGNGLFTISGGYLYFSLPLNKDPRIEKGRYTIAVPSPVSERTWALGIALFLIGSVLVSGNPRATNYHLAAIQRMRSLPDAWLILALFFLGLGVRAWEISANPEFSDGWFSIKGVPYSDAEGWEELAANLADGQGFQGGFSAQRPLFPAMLASFFSLTGPTLFSLKLMHCFLGGLAVAAVFGIGILGGSRLAGLVGAVALALNENDAWFLQMFMTEITGTAFTVTAVLALCIALEKPSVWIVVLSGLLLGCANLASGFSMLALPAYGSIVLITWGLRLGWRRAFSYTTLLVTVVALSWVPWLVRQHQVHGFSNLSASSANLLYAAANPAYGRLTPEAAAEWKQAQVEDREGPRYNYYMKRYKEMVAQYPLAYVQKVYTGMRNFFNYWRFEGPDHHGVIILGLLAALMLHLPRGRTWAVLLSGSLLIFLGYKLDGDDGLTLWLIGSILTLLTCKKQQRPAWLLVASTVVFAALLAGMTGGTLSRRIWTAGGWAMPLLIMFGVEGFLHLSTTWLEKLEHRLRHTGTPITTLPAAHPLSNGARLACMIILVTLVTLAALSSALATGRYLLSSAKNTVLLLDANTQAKALDAARQQFDFLSAVPSGDPRLEVTAIQVLYGCELENSEDSGHPAKDFEVRPYTRTVGILKHLDHPEGTRVSGQFRIRNEALPKHETLLLIGVHESGIKSDDEDENDTAEVLGFIPIDSKTQPITVHWDQATWLQATPEALQILKKNP
ncbi:hypothetical protein BH11VER1_BH11VER1_01550 [soil metagenome]